MKKQVLAMAKIHVPVVVTRIAQEFEVGYELAGTVLSDVADLEEVPSSILEGQFEVSRRLINELNTMVREEIPTRLYDRIVKGSHE